MIGSLPGQEANELGYKLRALINHTGNLPAEMAKRLKQNDLSTEVLFSSEDSKGQYSVAWLAKRYIATLPECLQEDRRFYGKSTYHELTLTDSVPLVDLKHKIAFYQALYPALHRKLLDDNDKQIVVKVSLTEHRWLREISFGPYEEVGFVPEELCFIALTSVETEAYRHFLNGEALELNGLR
jgi:hypothetical protein